MTRHVIATVDELPPGTRKFLTIDARPIAVFNINGEFFGLLNRCPHQGAALCEGPLIGLAQSSDPGAIEYTRQGEIIRCPWHGWEFDIRTGQSYCDPKRFRAKAYPVNSVLWRYAQYSIPCYDPIWPRTGWPTLSNFKDVN